MKIPLQTPVTAPVLPDIAVSSTAADIKKQQDIANPSHVIPPLVALVGNPNTGKTTLFNGLCRARQKTANYPGTTVEKKIGICTLQHTTQKRERVNIIDLPGLYSLQAAAYDETMSRQCLLGKLPDVRRPDLIVFVLDVTNLRRNLLLYSQLRELRQPILIALTMHDQMEPANIQLDLTQLQKELQTKIVPVTGTNYAQVEELKTAIAKALAQPSLFEIPDGVPQTSDHAGANLQRYRWIDSILKKVSCNGNERRNLVSQKWDAVLTHRFMGLFIFGAIMYSIFYMIYTGAEPAMQLIEDVLAEFSAWCGNWLPPHSLLRSLVQDGIISGVGAVLVFLPQIMTLFFFIALLEDSGYLVRAAFLMDRLFSWTGLNGRSFIPLLSSFACAIPGIMATRVMPEQHARRNTILIAPLMSCSARLPIYILLIGTLIEPRFGVGMATVCLFFMHGLGPLLALPLVRFLHGWQNTRSTSQSGIPFLMEFPPYRKPKLYNVYHRVYSAAKKFVIKAGSVIFVFSIVIWFLSYFPRLSVTITNTPPVAAVMETNVANHHAALQLEHSYLGRMGKFMAPVFTPLGFDWKITVAVLSSFPAREVILSTLRIIYNAQPAAGAPEEDSASVSLRQQLHKERHADGRPVYTPALAFSLMVFFALCSQCMSTLAIIRKELGQWKWSVFAFTYMTTLAYVFSFLAYQGASWFSGS